MQCNIKAIKLLKVFSDEANKMRCLFNWICHSGLQLLNVFSEFVWTKLLITIKQFWNQAVN